MVSICDESAAPNEWLMKKNTATVTRRAAEPQDEARPVARLDQPIAPEERDRDAGGVGDRRERPAAGPAREGRHWATAWRTRRGVGGAPAVSVWT